MTIELKPCPFCGGEAEISLDHTVEENHAYGCPKCNIWFDTFNSENAEAEWNTRAVLEAPPDETASLRAKLAREVERELTLTQEAYDAAVDGMRNAEADRDEERKLADDLIAIVEGIDGAMNHGTWRDDKGTRLKDTPQWVALYNAARRKEKQG